MITLLLKPNPFKFSLIAGPNDSKIKHTMDAEFFWDDLVFEGSTQPRKLNPQKFGHNE